MKARMLVLEDIQNLSVQFDQSAIMPQMDLVGQHTQIFLTAADDSMSLKGVLGWTGFPGCVPVGLVPAVSASPLHAALG